MQLVGVQALVCDHASPSRSCCTRRPTWSDISPLVQDRCITWLTHTHSPHHTFGLAGCSPSSQWHASLTCADATLGALRYRHSRYYPRSHLLSGSSTIEGIESSLDSGLRLRATVVPLPPVPCHVTGAPRYALLIMTKTHTHLHGPTFSPLDWGT